MFPVWWTCVVILAGIAQKISAVTFTPITSSNNITYYLSDTEGTYSEAVSGCSNAGMALATFENVNYFNTLIAALDDDGSYDDDQFWVEITTTGSQALGTDRYYFGSNEITPGAWYDDEPNYTCTTCCYRIKNPSAGSWLSSAKPRGLADNGCSTDYFYICIGSTATTTSITASSTAVLATSFTTIIPITTTTTTSVPTTSTEDTLTTTATTASTTDIITTTTTFAVAATSTTSAVVMSTITAVAVVEESPVSLSMGQQMTVVMLGLILGPAFGITCICAGFWLFVNRRCRRKKRPSEENKEEIKEEEDDSSSDSE